MSPRQPPITTALSGSPRTGRLVLPSPRPTLLIWVRRIGPETAMLTIEGHALPGIELRLVPHDLETDTAAHWSAIGATIDGYQWRVVADERMREIVLHDDVTQRWPPTPEQIVEWEAAARAAEASR